jgi:hypothetical protein
VCVLARNRTQDATRRSHCVASTFGSELYDVLRIEVIRVFREAGARGVLDALVDGKYREIPGLSEAAMIVNPLQIGQNANVSIGPSPNAIYEIGAGKMEALLGNLW